MGPSLALNCTGAVHAHRHAHKHAGRQAGRQVGQLVSTCGECWRGGVMVFCSFFTSVGSQRSSPQCACACHHHLLFRLLGYGAVIRDRVFPFAHLSLSSCAETTHFCVCGAMISNVPQVTARNLQRRLQRCDAERATDSLPRSSLLFDHLSFGVRGGKRTPLGQGMQAQKQRRADSTPQQALPWGPSHKPVVDAPNGGFEYRMYCCPSSGEPVKKCPPAPAAQEGVGVCVGGWADCLRLQKTPPQPAFMESPQGAALMENPQGVYGIRCAAVLAMRQKMEYCSRTSGILAFDCGTPFS